MNALVYLPLLVPVLAAAAGRPLAARLEPRLAAWLLTAAAVAVAMVIRARARALAESYRRAASMASGGRVVVVPGHSIEAYALPGSPGRIVVSGRLLDVLDHRGRAALLAHEHAHL